MNLLSKLLPQFAGDDKADKEREAEEAALKKERIKFHRDFVRNGPRPMVSPTTGQRRRAAIRAQESEGRKRFRAQKRAYFASQREAAVLRVHLQRMGVLPFGSPSHKNTPAEVERSVVWLLETFKQPATPEGLRTAIQSAYDRFAAITGLPTSKIDLAPEVIEAARA